MYGQARIRLPDDLAMLSRSQMETAIYEANLGAVDTELAKRYYIEKMAQVDIAALMGYDRRTVTRHVSGISKKVSFAARNLPQ